MSTAWGGRYFVARRLSDLGEAEQAAGRTPAARRVREEARGILEPLDHPDAAEVRDRLRRVPPDLRADRIPWSP